MAMYVGTNMSKTYKVYRSYHSTEGCVGGKVRSTCWYVKSARKSSVAGTADAESL